MILLTEVPAGAQFILLPETAVPRHYWEPGLTETRFDNEPGPFWQELADTLRSSHPQALLVTGAFTNRYYAAGLQPRTAVGNPYGDGYYDDFNTAVGLDSAGRTQLHHKGKLVIGVENTPTVIFDLMQFLVIDLGGVVGQIGMGQHGTAFAHAGMRMGPAICYEGLYGDFYGDFVRRGAQFMAIISNDGWWGDTPGYKHLFTISRLRAIEHRRAIARSANTGMSGFISARGDIGDPRLGKAGRDLRRRAPQLRTHLLHPIRRLSGPHCRVPDTALRALLHRLPGQKEKLPRKIKPETRYELHPDPRIPLLVAAGLRSQRRDGLQAGIGAYHRVLPPHRQSPA